MTDEANVINRLLHKVSVSSYGGLFIDGQEIVNQRISLVKEPDEPWAVEATIPVVDWTGLGEELATVSIVARLVASGPEFVDGTGSSVADALRALADEVERRNDMGGQP